MPETLELRDLIGFVTLDNIAEELDDATLNAIGSQVVEDFGAAKESMGEWSERTEQGLELVKPATKGRSEPWDGASNFKSPTLQDAAYRFGERASTELLRPKDLVQSEVIGADPDDEKKERGQRVATYQSYQVNHQIPEWRDEQRRLLYSLPNMGTIFKKTFFDPLKGRLVSDLIQYPDFAVDQATPSMEDLRDFTHILSVKENDVTSFKRAGLWLDIDIPMDNNADEEKPAAEGHDAIDEFLEQQCFYDIDGDGYEEPYIVTVHRSSAKVVRIVARFTRKDIILRNPAGEFDIETTADDVFGPLEDEFGQIDDENGEQVEGLIDEDIEWEIVKINPATNITAYRFLPSSDGTFLGVGYFQLMAALVQAINSGVNMLYDAATLSNLQGGWLAKGMRGKMGDDRFMPGQWKQTNISAADLQSGVYPLPFGEPSPTLLQLVNDIQANVKELSASADISELLGANTAASTVLLLIEETQGATTALMSEQARSMGKEFQIMYRLNAIFADPTDYQNVLNDPNANYEEDFNQLDLDLIPTANPELSSKSQRIQQGQVLMDQFDRIVQAGGNGNAIVRQFLEAINVENVDTIIPEPTQEFTQQQIATAQAQQVAAQDQSAFFKAQTRALDANSMRTEVDTKIKMTKLPEELEKLKAETIKLLEQAESEEVKNQTSVYTARFQAIDELLKAIGTVDNVQNPATPVGPGTRPPLRIAGASDIPG